MLWVLRPAIQLPRLFSPRYQPASPSSCTACIRRSMTSTSSSKDKPIDVLLVGLGSIGSVYAHILEKTGRARVTAVARSNYGLYTGEGVTLDTAQYGVIEGWKPHRVVKSQEEALSSGQTYDYCLLTTKCLPDVLPNARLLEPALATDQIKSYALIQNGLDVEKDVHDVLKAKGKEEEVPIVTAAAWIGLMTSPDGKRIHWSGPRGGGFTALGSYPPPAKNPSSSSAEKGKKAADVFAELLIEGGHAVERTDKIDEVRFQKNVWNCTWSSVEGLTRATPEYFAYLPPELQDQVKLLIKEIVGVGFKTGLLKSGAPQYPLGGTVGTEDEQCADAWSKVTGMSLDKVKAGQQAHRMSLLIDVEMGRPIEVEVIVGAVVRIAEKHNIPTPLLSYTYALLKTLQGRISH